MAAALNQGYDDERFESVVSKNYHCIICFNVFKDPVMCRNNEHLFCRACITEHLTNSKNCPMCMDELTIDTLREAPRFVTGCLAELKIRCEYFNQGCGFVELEKLEKHVKECDYAPVVCSNEGCNLEVNKRDLIHHETAVCEQRRVKCHNCEQMQQELKKVNTKLDNIETRFAQLNETLKQINANIASQNSKQTPLEISEAQHRSLQPNAPELNTGIKREDISENEESESEGERDRFNHRALNSQYEDRIGLSHIRSRGSRRVIPAWSGRGAREDRGGAREDRGGAREDRGGAREDRGGAKEDRGGAREDRGGAREERESREYERIGRFPSGERGRQRRRQKHKNRQTIMRC